MIVLISLMFSKKNILQTHGFFGNEFFVFGFYFLNCRYFSNMKCLSGLICIR